jgi:hypothetical protein
LFLASGRQNKINLFGREEIQILLSYGMPSRGGTLAGADQANHFKHLGLAKAVLPSQWIKASFPYFLVIQVANSYWE